MDDIKKLLDKTDLLSLKDTRLTIISLYGVSEARKPSNTVALANTIVGANVFTCRNEPARKPAIELTEGIQYYLDKNSKTIYLFADSNMNAASLSAEKPFSASMMDHQSATTKALLFMLIVSHLVIVRTQARPICID
ncbi:hypothetical protein BD408DRAFT_417216 [Parasitella parasitica]|nr:hypothetical protein BD408DRAFT_417216 [Parasitella parasitica]